MRVPKRSAQQEYRLKQRAQVEASPSLAAKFPRLRGLKATLEYFDPAGVTKNGELKCKMNLEHASAVVWFACRGADCAEGDFDLSEPLAEAVEARRKVAVGELRCQGMRKRGDRERVACRTLLRYKLNLDYDRDTTEKRRASGAGHSTAPKKAGPRTDSEEIPRAQALRKAQRKTPA